MSNTVRTYQRYLIGPAAPIGSQVHVSPECLVCVFLKYKKQTISIKEDEPIQLLLSCLFCLGFFFPSQPGSFLHLVSLARSHTSWPFWLDADFSCTGSGQVGGWKICCL